MINARVETLLDKPAFRSAVTRSAGWSCPADGYYEWQVASTASKVPHFLHGSPGPRVGLRRPLRDVARPDPGADDPDRWLWTYTILTTAAPDALGHIHDRSPVVVPDELLDAWLDPGSPTPTRCASCWPRCPSRNWCRTRSVVRSTTWPTTDHTWSIPRRKCLRSKHFRSD